jgi:ubiquinone/menaquinone biosynthesis C-methylase UbiE
MPLIDEHIKKRYYQTLFDRVDNYVKYRPGYPNQGIDYLTQQCNLAPGSVIADVGSGTGIFSALLLAKKYKVYGVEPNNEMRQWAEQIFDNNNDFISVNGTAEKTNLTANSIDLVVCAQAFHWFDAANTRKEFKRIKKNEAKQVALIWNNRLTEVDAFAKAYEYLLEEKATDYPKLITSI